MVKNDIWKLLGYARSKGLKTALSSNGVLITKDSVKKIKDLRVEYVGISLDGASEKIHDAVRNQPGSFRKSVQALKNCVEIGLKCSIRMTVTKDNYHEVSSLLDLAIELRVPRFCVYWLVPSGRGRRLCASQQLNSDEVAKILDLLYMKAKEFNPNHLEILTVDAPQDGLYILNKMRDEGSSEYEMLKTRKQLFAKSKARLVDEKSKLNKVENLLKSVIKSYLSSDNSKGAKLKSENR